MQSALTVDRLHFAFTITFHYIFPQVTMGLALLILILKTAALRTGDEHYGRSARFWARIFGINFALGVVTGIPMEFQFGTNWSAFSGMAGGVIGQTLAMEGVFSFFLESIFLGLFLFAEERLGRFGHWLSAFMVFIGAWLSGYFIVATDAWMQHPVAYSLHNGMFGLSSFWGLLLNPWTLWQYPHTMIGAVQTGCFLMAAIGAFYILAQRQEQYGGTFVRIAVIVGILASILQLYPTGDAQGALVSRYQPATLAAMEGLFSTERGAPLAILGQPDVANQHLDNPLIIPRALSFLTYREWSAEVKGLDQFPPSTWPDQIELVYFSYHVMVGLGTLFIAIFVISGYLLWRGALYRNRPMLWIMMLALPFPFIANTAGWVTAEAGRQPWLIYGLLKTSSGASPLVSAGNAWFTLIGFMGMYLLLGILYLFLVYREIERGPEAEVETSAPALAKRG